MSDPKATQAEKFAELARSLECDEDEDRFKELLGKVVKHKPVDISTDSDSN